MIDPSAAEKRISNVEQRMSNVEVDPSEEGKTGELENFEIRDSALEIRYSWIEQR